MDIGPLEYMVIGLEDDRFSRDVLPELNAIQQSGLIRVVDLLFIRKNADDTLTVQEVSELHEDKQPAYTDVVEDLAGLLTAEDIKDLAAQVPASREAVIVLLEHTWTLGLAEAVRGAGGVLFTGGMVHPDALVQVGTELIATKEEHHA